MCDSLARPGPALAHGRLGSRRVSESLLRFRTALLRRHPEFRKEFGRLRTMTFWLFRGAGWNPTVEAGVVLRFISRRIIGVLTREARHAPCLVATLPPFPKRFLYVARSVIQPPYFRVLAMNLERRGGDRDRKQAPVGFRRELYSSPQTDDFTTPVLVRALGWV